MKVNLFVLIPEMDPKFNWIANLTYLIEEENIINFVKDLIDSKKTIEVENYVGFYDSINLSDLIYQVKILEDSYPKPILKTLRLIFSDFYDWRENLISSENNYFIFNQIINNHILCEISQRTNDIKTENFAILNNSVISLNQILISINQNIEINNELLNNSFDLGNWFSEKRIPKRNFQAIQKHRILKPIFRNNKLISPLYGSEDNAENILKTAVGINSKELFGIDNIFNKVIIFKFENNNPQNQYHGYHVEFDSEEIPLEIKIKLDIL